MTGKIVDLFSEKGYGFIRDDTGAEYFFHRSAVSRDGFGGLYEGDAVRFDAAATPKGARAENVRRI